MGFLDFLGKAANAVSNWAPKIVKGVSGVANILNSFQQGKGQREAISGFIGDTFGQKYGRIANNVIGAGTSIFNTGKSIVNSAKNYKSNPWGSISNIASGIGNVVRVTGQTAGNIAGDVGGKLGGGLAKYSAGVNKVSDTYNTIKSQLSPLAEPARQLYQTGSGLMQSYRNSFRR